VNYSRLEEILSGFARLKILVVGDFFLDQYLVIEPRLVEISLETGLEAHQVVARRSSPGAAGTVCSNLAALGTRVEALGVVGEDGNGYELVQGLKSRGIGAGLMMKAAGRLTPTYTKPMTRLADGTEKEMERLDIKNRTPMPADLESELVQRLTSEVSNADGVIIGDQVQEEGCGVITATVRAELSRQASLHPHKVFLADSRCRVGSFRDLMIKPNEKEAMAALGTSLVDEAAMLPALFRLARKPVFLTRGEKGCYVYDGTRVVHCRAATIPGPIDTVGAGDSTSAGIVAALCAGATLEEAGHIGNLVASVTVRKLGTTGTATRQEVLKAFENHYRPEAR
jgi:rfaE bifunctional protein kinase chain/domain